MKKLLFVLSVLLIPAGVLAQGEPCFIGAWNFESSTDSNGVITYPGDLGFYPQIQFLADSSFTRLENWNVVAQGTWSVGTVWVQYFESWVCLDTLITTTGDSWHSASLVDENVLELLFGNPGSETRERYSFLSPTPVNVVSLGTVKSIYK